MTEATLMTDAATTTEGAPASSSAAPAPAPAPAAAEANAAQQQQVTQSVDSKAGQQPAGEQTEGEQDASSAEQQGAPEKYEFNAPQNVALDEQTMAAFSDVARELNMPQESAQKILDKMGPIMANRQVEALNTLNTAWVEGVRTDKEIGGEKLQENLAVAKKAMEKFGTPELRTLLNESRLGNHPEIIRAFYRAGKAISEDTIVGGAAAAVSGGKSAAQALYPNQPA